MSQPSARSLELAREALPCIGVLGHKGKCGTLTLNENEPGAHYADVGCPARDRMNWAYRLDALAHEVRAETLEEAAMLCDREAAKAHAHNALVIHTAALLGRKLRALATEPGGEGR